MSFSKITELYQNQINEHSQRPVTEEMIEDIEAILEEYCSNVEKIYGVNMVFDLRIGEDDGKLKYRVTPDSELDTKLLAFVVENESRVAPVSFRIQ